MFALRLAVLWAACLTAVLADTKMLDLQPPTTLAAENWEYRLSEHIDPIHYKIWLRPYLLESDGTKRFTFDGEVWIEIQPVQTTKLISLHSSRLTHTIREYWAKPEEGSTTQPTVVPLSLGSHNTETDIMNLTSTVDLVAKKSYILHFKYTGLMEDDMHGFYRSSYVNDNNETKWLGSTQFQTNHARRAFPSFDEPQFKATFAVTLIRHRTFNSVSNTRLVSSAPTNAEYFEDVYSTTPKMSTYLLAFIISEFSIRNDENFGVLSRPEFYAQTQYSFNVGRKILTELGKYFNLDYYTLGNDKMDMAAIPDFSAGAMENWGLLTYRERSVLYDESATTLASQQAIAAVVAHEQAHMWFGDLVTCKWWSYTWLNEGFARFFQYFGTAMVETEWELEKQFVVDQVQSVMGMDATNATNPLSDPNTYTPAHLSRMFNSISYNKGGSFIRMIEHTMGTEMFQKSLQEYLKKYQYQSSEPEFLLNAWRANWPNDRFNSSAEEIFKSFTEQVGYPVVHVNVKNDFKSAEFSQKRFLLKANDNADPNLRYTVPISYTTNADKDFNNTRPKFVLPKDGSHTVDFTSPVSWVLANIQETGYYRVNYSEHNWHAIHAALGQANWGDIHQINRAQVVDDLFNLARAGHIHYDLTLAVLEYLETEYFYIPWTSAFNGFNFLAIRLGTDTTHFSSYIRQLTWKAYERLGFAEQTTDEALHIYLRTKVLSWTCRYGNTDCINQAKTYFKSLSTVPKNIRSVVYCVGLREGGEAEFNAVYQKFKTEKVATEETLLQTSFGCVKTQPLIERVFNLVLSEEIRRQDKAAVLSTLYTENNENVSPVFTLVTEKFEQLATAMGGYAPVATVISNIAARFTEQSQHDALVKFNDNNGDKFGSSKATLIAAQTTVKENLVWAEDKLGHFRTYLAKRNGSAMISAFSALTLLLVALGTLMR